MVPSCLVLAPGMIKEENIASWNTGREKGYGGELAGFHIRGMLLAESFAISENWQAQGSTVYSQQEMFCKMSKHDIIQLIILLNRHHP